MNQHACPPPFVGSEFPDREFQRLCALLLERRGFDLGRYKDRCIKRRIAIRVRACGYHAAQPYLDRLERDDAELDALMSALVINVSQFFRNPETWRVIGDVVLPALATAACRDNEPLRLWSVGCAAGEEPYSLALLVAEMMPSFPGLEVEILGSDVSTAALERARHGVYEPTRLAEVPRLLLEKYFHPAAGGYQLRDEIRRRVRFERWDVLAATADPEARLILCRNLLIYFSRGEQNRILRRFAAALGPEGYLVLGRAETMMGEVRRWFAAEYPVERIYRCTQVPPEAAGGPATSE